MKVSGAGTYYFFKVRNDRHPSGNLRTMQDLAVLFGRDIKWKEGVQEFGVHICDVFRTINIVENFEVIYRARLKGVESNSRPTALKYLMQYLIDKSEE